jgi:transcriptional regulator with XRE-family HTH domain
MKMSKKAEKYKSSILTELLRKITPLEKEKVRAKMQLAVRLDELIKAAGLSKGEFAERLGKNPSEISKWLSGTHNFTLDTLAEISNAFNIALPELFLSPTVKTVNKIHFVVVSGTRPQDIVYDTPNALSFSSVPSNVKKGKYSPLTPF